MKSASTGPALGGAEAIWLDEFSPEDLYSWIRNSQAMIAAGHPRAVQLWEQYKPTIMTPMPNLTDAEIANILGYIEYVYSGQEAADNAGAGGSVEVAEGTDDVAFSTPLLC